MPLWVATWIAWVLGGCAFLAAAAFYPLSFLAVRREKRKRTQALALLGLVQGAALAVAQVVAIQSLV